MQLNVRCYRGDESKWHLLGLKREGHFEYQLSLESGGKGENVTSVAGKNTCTVPLMILYVYIADSCTHKRGENLGILLHYKFFLQERWACIFLKKSGKDSTEGEASETLLRERASNRVRFSSGWQVVQHARLTSLTNCQGE